MKLIQQRLTYYFVLHLVLKIAHSQVGQMDRRLPQSLQARNICYKCKTTFINKYSGETTCAEYIESCCPGYEGLYCDVECFNCLKFRQIEKRYELIYYKMKYFQEKLMTKNDNDEQRNGKNGNDTDVRSTSYHNGVCTCQIGPEGKRGPPGPQGPRGPPGSPGSSDNTGLLGNGSSRQCPPGRDGPPGPKGSQGESGRDGMPGQKGEPGDIGHPGPPGSIGSKGPRGQKGQVGPKGENGSMGPEGKMGPKGSMGQQGPPGMPGILGVDTDVFKRLADEFRILNEEFTNYKRKVLEQEEAISELKSRNCTAPPPFPFTTSTSYKKAQSDATTTQGNAMATQGDATVSTKYNEIAGSDFMMDMVTPTRKQIITSNSRSFNCREKFDKYKQMIMKEGLQEPPPLAPIGTHMRAKQCRILKKILKRVLNSQNIANALME